MYPICACDTSIHESHISFCFALRPAIFKLQVILKQVHRMTPNQPWTLQVSHFEQVLQITSNC